MDIIRVNLPSLIEKTGNSPILTDNLFAEKVISTYDKQLINSKATLTEKNSILYDIVMTKGDIAFGKLINCLKRSENEHIVAILEGQQISGRSSKMMNHLIWFEIRPMSANYTGRESELEKLNNEWKTSQRKHTLEINLISGLGGVGKSELSRVFVTHLHLEERVNCIWFNSETDGSFLESVRRLAAKMQIEILDQTGREKDVYIIISDIFDHLSGEKVILVFDNLEKITGSFKIALTEIEKLELLGPKEIKPFVIITTRFQVLLSELSGSVKLIEIEALTPICALTFLIKALEIEGHDQDKVLLELARRLQYFPLDLTQAVGFIQSKSSQSMKLSGRPFGVKEYIELFDKEKKDLLDFHAVSFGRLSPRSETTYINWRVAREGLGKHSEIGFICMKLMSAISFFSPDGISVPDFVAVMKAFLKKQLSSNDSRAFSGLQIKSGANKTVGGRMIDEAINLCSEYSLFSLKNGVVYVHRLVQEVIRVELANRAGFDKEVISVLADCFVDKVKSQSLPRNCIQHAVQVWEHISGDAQLVEKHNNFPQVVFNELQRDIKYTECTSFASKAIEVLSSVVGGIEVTLHLMHSRCVVLALNGNYAAAGIEYRKLFKKRKALLGAEHKDTLSSEFGIGQVLYFHEKYVEALVVLEKVVSIQERILGNEHADALRTKDLIAAVFQRQDKYDEALLIYREINAIRENVFGKEHTDTLKGKNNMAVVLDSQQKHEEALQIYYEVDEIKERVLGGDHPETLSGKYNIATTLHEMGQNSQALLLLREVYEKMKRVLGIDHPYTVKSKAWIDKINAAVNKI